MTIGFIGTLMVSPCAYAANTALMSKSIVDSTFSRGVFLSASATMGSLGIGILDLAGGHLYDADKRSPIFFAMGVDALVVLIIIFLAVGK